MTSTAAQASISREEVAHLAKLARIELDGEHLDALAGELGVILTSVARVSEVAAQDVPPMSHPVPLTNVMRADVVHECLTQDEALSGAPDREDGRFRVPRILGEAG